MTKRDRDRLVTVKKADQRVITQSAAAEELGLSERQVKRLVAALRREGDKAVVHGLSGTVSNRRIDEKIEQEAVRILSEPVYRDFGPTLAAEYLESKHSIHASRETVRQWMMRGGLWRGKKAEAVRVHCWRERRSRYGELVQWDTSTHDWLEGRDPEPLYLIAMIDDATSRLFARFVRSDSTEENMRLLKSYLEKFGRPMAFYTDKASLFRTAEKRKREDPGVDRDPVEMPPTQIGRALRELGIVWIGAHSAQAKGRVERNFETAQDRLVKGLRVAGVNTIEPANRYLEEEYLIWWDRNMTVAPAHPDDAHRALDDRYDLGATLSYVEDRQVRNDYTIRWEGHLYQIEPRAVVTGLRGAKVRVERRLDGSLAVRYGERYLPIRECQAAEPATRAPEEPTPHQQPRVDKRGSDWNRNFQLKDSPPLWKILNSGQRSES